MKKWFECESREGDIVISSRIRLARNLANTPFPTHATPEQAERVVSETNAAMERLGAAFEGFARVDLSDDKQGLLSRSLVENHLISAEFADAVRPKALYLSKDEAVSLMVNEEDHIRLQVLGAGLCLSALFETADKLDDLLDETLHFAFDEKLGYLTECPTNLGCGLRAGVMLHLPALTQSGHMARIMTAAQNLGISIRGLYGEGSEASGNIYQISNRLTLGRSEKEIISQLESTVMNMIRDERRLRASLKENTPLFEDRIYRAKAILSSARLMRTGEAMALLSDLRLGLGLEGFPDTATLNALLWKIQPASLSLGQPTIPDTATRDILRAELLRESLERS